MTGKLRLYPTEGKATITLTSAGSKEAGLMRGFFEAAVANKEALPEGVKIDLLIGAEHSYRYRRCPVKMDDPYPALQREDVQIVEFTLELQGADGKPMPMLPPTTKPPALEGNDERDAPTDSPGM